MWMVLLRFGGFVLALFGPIDAASSKLGKYIMVSSKSFYKPHYLPHALLNRT